MSVYFATFGEYMKIGHSVDPIARSQTITRLGKRPADIPFAADVDLVGWIPGDEWRERELHVKHIADRVEGEWFILAREVAEVAIWDDPRGVDLNRMSGLAVMAMRRNPDVTREQIEQSGIPLMAATDELAWWRAS